MPSVDFFCSLAARRCWKNSFWLVTLLYPRCAMTALQLFSTQKLDSGTYLISDYSILVSAGALTWVAADLWRMWPWRWLCHSFCDAMRLAPP